MGKFKYKILKALRTILPIKIIRKITDFTRHYFGGLYHRVDEHHAFLYAGGITFSIFTCIIPLILIAFSVLGFLLDDAQIEGQIIVFIYAFIPIPEYANYAKDTILGLTNEVIEYQTWAAILGGLGLLFTASGLFSSLRTVLNKIFGVSKDKSAFIAKLRDFGMVLLLIIFMLLSIVVLPLLNLSISKANDFEFLKIFRLEDLWNYLLSFTSFIVIFLMFFVFYYFIPYERIGRRIPLVAAFWTSILWEIARRVFEFYIAHFAARINQIYGVYALLLIIALWIYYAAVLFIIGAEIGQLYKERLLKISKYKEPQKRKNIIKDWVISKFKKNQLRKE